MAEPLTFEQLAEFIRESSGISQRKAIAPETQFERDLGITGDDGCELLEAVEEHFATPLHTEEDGYREIFSLGANEYLFHSEGGFLPLFNSQPIITLFGSESSQFGSENVRAFTVGDLYNALQKQNGNCGQQSQPSATYRHIS